jgi:transcriptional regulator with XRE-family HTH domain
MIGAKIRELRKARKMSQEELAARISEISGVKISRQSLSGWESGEVAPRTANLQAAARVLNVPLSELLEELPMPSNVTPVPLPDGKQVFVPLLSPEVTACCGDGIPTYSEITNEPDEVYMYTIADLGGTYDQMRPPFAVRADGACLEKSGIQDGDILIFNPALEPRQGKICIVCWGGALSAKKVVRRADGSVVLHSDVDSFIVPAEEARDPERFAIWGPVVQSRHAFR